MMPFEDSSTVVHRLRENEIKRAIPFLLKNIIMGGDLCRIACFPSLEKRFVTIQRVRAVVQ